MRSHAKASTAGSTQRQAKGLGRIFRGAVAIRGVSHEAKGSGAPKTGPLALWSCALLGALIALALAATPAAANKTHLFKEIFGSAAQPSFGNPRLVAIDQGTGEVLVVDSTTGSVQRYNPDGTPSNFSALGTNAVDGKDGADATPQNELFFNNSTEHQIAVDNSGTATDGNIYVTQRLADVVDVFASTGAYLGQLTAAGITPLEEPCGVATDASGAVYVADRPTGVHKYVPAANPPVNADKTVDFTAVSNPCGLAAGAGPSAGFIFVTELGGPVSKLDSATGELKYVVDAGVNSSVGLDPASGHLFTLKGNEVHEYDVSGAGSASKVSTTQLSTEIRSVAASEASGDLYLIRDLGSNVEVFNAALSTFPDVLTGNATAIGLTGATLNGSVNPDGQALSECLFEWGTSSGYGNTAPCVPNAAGVGSGTSPVAVAAEINGLDVATTYHFRLKAANSNGPILGGDETLQTLGPRIAATWSEDVVFGEATLKAEIDPEGLPTTYHFEYGTSTAYGSQTPELAVGSDSSVHEVTRFLQGLEPGTTYHYRVIATNGDGVNEGSDHILRTFEPFAPETNCANQAFRLGASANLPDCRAYELVSPLDKGGRGIIAGAGSPNGTDRASFDRAATGGEAITYTSATAFGDAVGNRNANQYLARRGPNGWSTHSISPALKQTVLPQAGSISEWHFQPQFLWFSDDLSTAVVKDHNQVPLTPDAQEGFGNIFRRDNLTGTYSEPLITSEPLLWGGQGGGALAEGRLLGLEFKGRSEDGSRLIFESEAQLTPDAPATDTINRVYEYSDGQLKLVSVLPGGGAAVKGANVGGKRPNTSGGGMTPTVDRAVSEDGSRIFWTEESGDGAGFHRQGHVYVRIDGQTTVAVSESVTPERSRFWTASTDGAKVVFSYEAGGTESFSPGDGSGGGTQEKDLYEFDVDTETPTLIAHRVGNVVGASEDLSDLYFTSRAALDAGATAGQDNLYLRRNGTIEFIATVAFTDVRGYGVGNVMSRPVLNLDPDVSGVRVTPDGSHIVFMSSRSLTGYDNTDAVSGKADTEVYLYDADAVELTCVSCNLSGARPHGASTGAGGGDGVFGEAWVDVVGNPEKNETSPWWAAAWIPGWENEQLAARLLSPDGNRVFFNAHDALLPQDTNGRLDVYQWEAPGTGSCELGGTGYSEQNKGCISLISTGKSDTYSELIDSTPNGSDVFIRTESGIDPRDTGLMDIYDARVGGGYPPPPPPPPPCVGDACQNVPAPPNDPTPASASFRGAGDPVPRKARRRCATRKRNAAKGKRTAKKQAKRCKRAKRRVSR